MEQVLFKSACLLLKLQMDLELLEIERWFISVADPDPSDPYVFGPLGSGSVSQRYGSCSGSGSFYQQAKIVSKTLIPTVL
jgi:hypothetical protein